MRTSRIASALIGVLFLPGCVEVESVYVLRADGTGSAKWEYKLQKEMRDKVVAYEAGLRKVLPQGTELLLPGVPERLSEAATTSLKERGLQVTSWRRVYSPEEMSLRSEAEFAAFGSLANVRRVGAASVRFELVRDKDGAYRMSLVKEADPEEESRMPGFRYTLDNRTSELALGFLDEAQTLQRKQSRVVNRVAVPGKILDFSSCGVCRLEGESVLVMELSRKTLAEESERRKAAKEPRWTPKDPLLTLRFRTPEGTEIPAAKLAPAAAVPSTAK